MVKTLFMKTNSNFWNQLETKQISKEQLQTYLITKLGQPTNPTQTNLLTEILKKINSYYFASEIQNTTVFSLIGKVAKASDIIEKKFKEGKNKDQVFYNLKITSEDGKELLQARQEDMPTDKWNRVKELAILGQKLLFKYKKYITNKQLLDFYPIAQNQGKSKK